MRGFGGAFVILWAVIFFGILGVFVLTIASNMAMYVGADTVREHAEVEARDWTAAMYPEADSITTSCQALDTDGNGYVTCTVLAGGEHLNLECYAWLWMNPGGSDCREIMPVRVYTSPR